MATMIRILVVLGLKRKNYPHLLARAWAIYNALLAKPALFVTINVALILTRIQAFDTAQKAVATKAVGTSSARNLAAAALVTVLETARAMVQELVDASPDQAAVIIDSAAMLMGQLGGYSKPILKATQAKAGGPVHLAANVGALTTDTKGKVFFNWQYSVDGGKTWLAAPSTPHGNTDLVGLTALETYSFRTSVTDRNDTSAWSQAVTLMVH